MRLNLKFLVVLTYLLLLLLWLLKIKYFYVSDLVKKADYNIKILKIEKSIILHLIIISKFTSNTLDAKITEKLI